MGREISIFLDSGAYSAKWQGVEISLQSYIDFIKENEHLVDAYCNLDVIGEPEATWKNQKIMEDAGLSPLPVFHLEQAISQEFQYLERCLEYDYFCLGGMARGFTTESRKQFMDKCWGMICDDGWPKCKVHGLGLAAPELLMRYPWYSVDTTSWVMYGRYGIILVPRYLDDFTIPPWGVFMSDRSPSKREIDGKHISAFTDMERVKIGNYITSNGYTVEELATDWTKRDELNLIYYLNLEATQPKWPWRWEPDKGKAKMERLL